MFKVGNSYVSPVLSKYENSVTKIMSKYFKLTVSSMTMHDLYIKTPDDINEDDIHRDFRKFDGGSFSSDDGDWEYSETEEIDEEEFEDETLNKCDWEDRYV